MTLLIDKPPTGEQIERIRQVSKVAFGDHGAAFAKWGYPSTRGQASDLIRKLDETRKWGGEDHADLEEEPMTQTTTGPAFNPPVEDLVLDKTCSHCGETKPIAEFARNRKAKDGLEYHCKACKAKQARERRARARGDGMEETRRSMPPKPVEPAPSVPEVPTPAVGDTPLSGDEAWRQVFANPTLTQLEALDAFLGHVGLEEAARITRLVAEGFGTKERGEK